MIINNDFHVSHFIIQLMKLIIFPLTNMLTFSFIGPFWTPLHLLAHLLQLDCCGPEVKACAVCSQLLWKENIPPIITSPSLLSWGRLNSPLKLHREWALLTTVNRSHVRKKLIVTLQKTPWPLGLYITILTHKLTRTRGRALTVQALSH